MMEWEGSVQFLGSSHGFLFEFSPSSAPVAVAVAVAVIAVGVVVSKASASVGHGDSADAAQKRMLAKRDASLRAEHPLLRHVRSA